MADKTRPDRRVTWHTSVQPVHTLKCLWNHRINGTAEHCCICIPGRACVERFVDLLAAPGLTLERPTPIGGPPPPKPDQSDHCGRKRHLQQGKSGRAIFSPQPLGSQIPTLLLCNITPPPLLQSPTPPPPLGDRHFHVFLVNMYCAVLSPSALHMALHCFPITSNQALCVFCDILSPMA